MTVAEPPSLAGGDGGGSEENRDFLKVYDLGFRDMRAGADLLDVAICGLSLLLGDGHAAHRLVDGVCLVVEVLHTPQRDPGLRAHLQERWDCDLGFRL